MLVINVTESESIDKALKKYKRKFERSGTLKELRRRKNFTKPSVERRFEVLKAVYKEQDSAICVSSYEIMLHFVVHIFI